MRSMDITIRSARSDDIPRMCELLAALFLLESDFTPDKENQKRGLGMLVADASGMSHTLVAVCEGAIIAMATIQTLISTAEGGRVGLVEDVIVDREYRGREVGTRLLEGITIWSREKGLRRLQLLADAENMPALDFYKNRRWNTTRLICLRKLP
jgi:GNAT superfamily N-acetyltransferase